MLALMWYQSLATFVFLAVCVLLILLILIQKGRGGGLSGAFGGVGSYSPFGTKTGDALTWATVILTGLYLLFAVLANYAYHPTSLSGLNPGLQAPATQPGAGGTAQPADDTTTGTVTTDSAEPAPGPEAASEAPAPAPTADQPTPAAPAAPAATQP